MRRRADDETCAPAATALRGKPRGAGYLNAVRTLMSCPQRGPIALAAEWASPPNDTTDLRLLGAVSGNLRDNRILDAVRGIALQNSRPREVRLAALRTLVRYFDPRLAVEFKEPPRPDLPDAAYVMLGEWSHPPGNDGSQPLPASVRQDVLDVLAQLETSPGDTVVEKVARYLRKRLEERGKQDEPGMTFQAE